MIRESTVLTFIKKILVLNALLKTKIKQTNTFFLTKEMEGKGEEQGKKKQNIEVDIRISRSKEEHKISQSLRPVSVLR